MMTTNTNILNTHHGVTNHDIRLVVADLDGTLLHGAQTFEERFLSERSVATINRMHEAGYLFAIATARPVSTGFVFADRLPVDAVVYLNGALLDFDPAHSDFDLLTGAKPADEGHLMKIGFSPSRACAVCRELLRELPTLKIGIVMDDVRYTNFDVSNYWQTQTWQYTDFSEGDLPTNTVADKIIAFPTETERDRLRALIPDDFTLSISEGTLWMLMNPNANKRDALGAVCARLGITPVQTVTFGDDLVDIDMMRFSGLSVAVANANPQVLAIADEICPSNDEDGVAQWIEEHLL